jgi:tripartite-type tricarboxylate transporter receptor subunit TctC
MGMESRRVLLKWLFVSLVSLSYGFSRPAAAWAAGAYPDHPVRIICGFPAGSTLDIASRIFAHALEEKLGQPFIVENRVGASGNIAADMVAHAAPDGYTLLTGGISQAISMSLFKDINYDIVNDLAPIGFISNSPNILVVNKNLNVASVPELIALAKSRPGELTYGTGGVGTAPHLSGELFNMMAGVKLLHVPYRGTNQAVIDLLSGRISLMFAPTATIAPNIHDDRLKLLAVTSADRSDMVPDLPPLAETTGLAGFDTSVWQGLWAPKGTPKDIVDRINAILTEASGGAAVKKSLDDVGTQAVIATPEKFGSFVDDEVKKWAAVVKFSGAKAD